MLVHKLIMSLFLILVFSALAAAQTEYKVVVNSSNRTDWLSVKQVSDIFLKKSIKWSDGVPVLPVDQKSDSKIRQNFTKNIHNKTVNAISAYWQKQIFSARGVPPVEKSSDAEVLSYVKSNPGAIGYVSSGTPTDNVKVIRITKFEN